MDRMVSQGLDAFSGVESFPAQIEHRIDFRDNS